METDASMKKLKAYSPNIENSAIVRGYKRSYGNMDIPTTPAAETLNITYAKKVISSWLLQIISAPDQACPTTKKPQVTSRCAHHNITNLTKIVTEPYWGSDHLLVFKEVKLNLRPLASSKQKWMFEESK